MSLSELVARGVTGASSQPEPNERGLPPPQNDVELPTREGFTTPRSARAPIGRRATSTLPHQRLKKERSLDSPLEMDSPGGSTGSDLRRQNEELKARLAGEAADHRRRLDAYRRAQQGQAALVSRLQAKVLQYKQRCSELETQMVESTPREPAYRPKTSASAIALPAPSTPSSNEYQRDERISDLETALRKLDDEKRKCEKLVAHNTLLREQLEESHQLNEALTNDLQKLTNDWEALRDEMAIKEDEWKDEEQAFNDYYSSEHNRLLSLWREVVSVKRLFAELQTSTERDLYRVKSDFDSVAREMVGTLSGYAITAFATGQGVKPEQQPTITSSSNTYTAGPVVAIESLRVELREATSQRDNALTELKERNSRIQRLLGELQGLEERCDHAETLCSEAAVMRSALEEVARALIHDSEADNGSHVHLQERSPQRNISKSANATAFAESTISAVQAALHKYQIQIHELQVKLQNSREQLQTSRKQCEAAECNIASLDNKVHDLQGKLDQANADLNQMIQEKESLQKTVESLRADKGSLERNRLEINAMVESLTSDYEKLQKINARLEKTIEALEAEKRDLNSEVDHLHRDAQAREAVLRAEEERSSRFRSELVTLREELNRTSLAKELLDQQKLEADAHIAQVEKHRNELEMELERTLLERGDMQDLADKLEAALRNLEADKKKLIEDLKHLEEEKSTLSSQSSEQHSDLNSLRKELLAAEQNRMELEADKASLHEKVKFLEGERERVELELRQVVRERGELSSQLTAMVRKKDALNEEMMRMQQRLEQANETIGRLNRALEEHVKHGEDKQMLLDTLEKEKHHLQEQLSGARCEKDALEAVLFDTANMLEDCESRKNKLEHDLQEALVQQENYKGQIARLTKDLENSERKLRDTRTSMQQQSSKKEAEYQQIITNINKTTTENITKLKEEKEQLRQQLEQKLSQTIASLTSEKESSEAGAREREKKLLAQRDQLMLQHDEAMLRAENDKQQALLMAHQEQQALIERLEEAKRELDSEQSKLERCRRDGQARADQDRTYINQLKDEIAAIKNKLEEAKATAEDDLSRFENRIKELHLEKEAVTRECTEMRAQLSLVEDKYDNAYAQLQDTMRKIKELETEADSLRKELTDVRRQLTNCCAERDKYNSSCRELREQVKRSESERREAARATDEAYHKITGIIGLTENLESLNKWLLAAPELMTIITDFEKDYFPNHDKETIIDTEHTEYDPEEETEQEIDLRHTSDSTSEQKRFVSAVTSLKLTFETMGNPFLENSTELFNIDTKMVAPVQVVETIQNIERHGKELYQKFCKERFQQGKSLHDPIPLNKLPLFHNCNKRHESKAKSKISSLKNDCNLFSKLYIATCEHRSGDLDTFFAHENQSSPPALSTMGTLRSGVKSDLLKCLTEFEEQTSYPSAPAVTAKILDGSAIVHMLNPGPSTTFGEYAADVFCSYLLREISNVTRLDVVWDTYKKGSLKNATREKRGSGQRTLVGKNTKIPKGWANFLREEANKEDLYHLLSTHCYSSMAISTGKQFVITDSSTALCKSTPSENIAPCNHEEADTRMMLHLADAVSRGHSKVLLRTVDTDVVVLAVSCIPKLQGLEELWVHIGTGKSHQYLACHTIASCLALEETRTSLELEVSRLQNLVKETEAACEQTARAGKGAEGQLKRERAALQQAQHDIKELHSRLQNESEERERCANDAAAARRHGAELEAILNAARGELANTRQRAAELEEACRARDQELVLRLEDCRSKERRLEELKHNLEVCLADATQQIQELKARLGGSEGRCRALEASLAQCEGDKRAAAAKLSTMVHTLRRVCGVQPDGSVHAAARRRIASPTRRYSPHRGRDRDRDHSEERGELIDVDPELIKKGVRNLMHEVCQIERERDDYKSQLNMMKKQLKEASDQHSKGDSKLHSVTTNLRSAQEEKARLQSTVGQKEAQLNALNESVQAKIVEISNLRDKITSLEAAFTSVTEEKLQNENKSESLRVQLSERVQEVGQLREALAAAETRATRLEVRRAQLEGDVQRAVVANRDRDHALKKLQERCEAYSRTIASLEDRCTSLKGTVEQLSTSLQKAAAAESELRAELSKTQRQLNEAKNNEHNAVDKLRQIQKSISNCENERRVLTEKLESAKSALGEMKRANSSLEDQVHRLTNQLANIEVQRSGLESQLRMSTWDGKESSDSDLERELHALQRERTELKAKNDVLENAVRKLEADRRMTRPALRSKSHDRTDKSVYYSDIDSGPDSTKDSIRAFKEGCTCKGKGYSADLSLLELENRELKMKIRRLEKELADKESELSLSRARLLSDVPGSELRGDTEHYRQTALQAERMMEAREASHRQQILRLEAQASQLRAQLAAEIRRRQSYVARSGRAARDMQRLRTALGDSLRTVAQDPALDSYTLEHEARKLDSTLAHSLPPLNDSYDSSK